MTISCEDQAIGDQLEDVRGRIMDEKEIRTQAMLQTLVNQRNAALNSIAQLEAEIAIFREKLNGVESKLKEKTKTENENV